MFLSTSLADGFTHRFELLVLLVVVDATFVTGRKLPLEVHDVWPEPL